MANKTEIHVCRPVGGGHVEVKLKKFNADGSWVYHRTLIEPGVDPVRHMGEINAHIARMAEWGTVERATFGGGRPEDYFDRFEPHAPLSAEQIAYVAEVCAGAHTPELVAERRQQVDALNALHEAQREAARLSAPKVVSAEDVLEALESADKGLGVKVRAALAARAAG